MLTRRVVLFTTVRAGSAAIVAAAVAIPAAAAGVDADRVIVAWRAWLAAERAYGRLEVEHARRRAVDETHDRAGLTALLAEMEVQDARRYDLGYELAEMNGSTPVDLSAAAWVAAASMPPGSEWSTLPGAMFARLLRAGLPHLPADLAEAVQTALASAHADDGFRRAAEGTAAGEDAS